MKTRLLALVVGLQVAWLLGTAFTAQRSLDAGQIIRLETVPVDPRDLLRGDYVILRYAFSLIPADRFDPSLKEKAAPPPGTPVYVELTPEGEFHRMTRASLERPVPAPGHVVLRGTVTWQPHPSRRETNTVHVDFGLERFYVREGTGRPEGKLTVDVSVPDSGLGMIKQVYLDDVPYADAMRDHAR